MFYTQFPANTFSTPGFFPEQGGIFSYIKSTQIFVCPTDSTGQRTGNSYSANYCVFGRTAGGFGEGKNLAVFENSAAWMLMGEEGISADNPSQNSTDDAYFNLDAGNVFALRHFEGSNVLYLDGHAKWNRNEKIFSDNLLTGGVALTPAQNRGDGCPN
jgi:prepilin-type processing-associated H-X9-DG protein